MNAKSVLALLNYTGIALLLLSAAASLFVGIEYTDTGYILGLAHRISIGQQIYFDFDYVRPPLSPLLWSLPLHLNIESKELLVRALVLLQKLAISFLLYKTLRKCEVQRYLAIFSSVITFSFLMHNIPMMPWHTVDGLFFAAIAVTFYAYNLPILAIVFAILAALTKQSFYLLPIVLIMISFVQFSSRRLAISISLVFIVFALWQNSYLSEFTRISSETTSLKDFISFAIAPHIMIASNIFSSLFFVCMLTTMLVFKRRSPRHLIGIAILFPIANIGAIICYRIITKQGIDFVSASYGVTQISMIFSIFHMFIILKKNGYSAIYNKRFQVAIILLSAAWMSSISWGYSNYMFAYGFLLSANLVLLKDSEALDSRLLSSLSCLIIAAFLIFRLVAPYRMDSPITHDYRMVEFGHYQYIWASEIDFEKLGSVVKLSELEGCIDTYPSVPQSALIGGFVPPLRADWKMDVEFPSYTTAESTLAEKRCKLFLEKDQDLNINHGRYSISAINLENYQHCIVDFDEHFYLIDFSICESR